MALDLVGRARPSPSASLPASWREALRSAVASNGALPAGGGLLLLLVAAALAMTWLPRLQTQTQALQRSTTAADAQLKRQQKAAQAPALSLSPSEQFASGFATADQRQERLGALFASATQYGLKVQRSELSLSTEPGLNLLKYSVVFPVVGSYAQLRGFAQNMLSADADLSLDRVRMQKSAASGALVDADMTWSFYMRAPPAVASAAVASKSTTAP